ncbi:MAG: hypothetical protein IJV01_06730 [Bacteroidales bacterium]|nr:hypothetical protein [Bacteroidales bacterium]
MKSFLVHLSGVFSEEKEAVAAACGAVLPGKPEWLDFRHLDGVCGYCEPEAEERLSEALRPTSVNPSLCWIDTGDYHYLSALRLRHLPCTAFTLLLLDHHSDCQPPAFGGELLSCGGWVRDAAHLPGLKNVVTLGPSGPGMLPEGTTPQALDAALPEGLPLFLSLDLDILGPEWFQTDWDQGHLALPALLDLLEPVLERPLLGIDLCGGITRAKGATDAELARNHRVRCTLASFILERV